MANKVHSINIGGKDRTLHYSFTSFRALTSVAQKITGRATSWFEWLALDHPELWAATICYALTGDVRDLTLDRVAEWLEDLLKDGQDIRKAALWPAQRALGESGVCGKRWTISDDGKLVWFDEESSGKASSASQ